MCEGPASPDDSFANLTLHRHASFGLDEQEENKKGTPKFYNLGSPAPPQLDLTERDSPYTPAT